MKNLFFLLLLAISVFAKAQEKIIVTQNIQYDEHKSCVLDVAQPITSDKALRPAIIIIHGDGRCKCQEPQETPCTYYIYEWWRRRCCIQECRDGLQKH
ncbi:MAG: hypothetical protein MJZ41_10230 [Bacteroidaceae bacterium]|nr:hypothetical protein [Bacteroidaceae bacterium]